ncbi:hypothetical protein R5R35_014821 [Gryllus longicercus]|uniref:VTT domain-containing protein n=1 Tax=Gryllus longicercus TaxID=2509291 RepID=A0AAN9Z4C5_9ORTH
MPSVFSSVSSVACTVLAASCFLYILTCLAPPVSTGKENRLRFPSNLRELQQLAELLQLYYSSNSLYVLVLFSSAYLYKQAFIIPGSALLNVLAGALFGTYVGFPLCCFLTACGATCCYLLSQHCARTVVEHYFPDKVMYFQKLVEKNSHQMIYFLLFLRLFPMTPNWLLNLISPIVQIPLHLFFFTVLIGLMPYNFMCVQAGEMLASLRSLDLIFNFQTVIKLAGFALVALLPSFVIKKTVVVGS